MFSQIKQNLIRQMFKFLKRTLKLQILSFLSQMK